MEEASNDESSWLQMIVVEVNKVVECKAEDMKST